MSKEEKIGFLNKNVTTFKNLQNTKIDFSDESHEKTLNNYLTDQFCLDQSDKLQQLLEEDLESENLKLHVKVHIFDKSLKKWNDLSRCTLKIVKNQDSESYRISIKIL